MKKRKRSTAVPHQNDDTTEDDIVIEINSDSDTDLNQNIEANTNETEKKSSKPEKSSSNRSNSPALLQHAQLPGYLAEAFEDLYHEDGLVVFGRGLGLIHLIAACCRFYVDTKEGHYSLIREELEEQRQQETSSSSALLQKLNHKRPLIFVIGLQDHERKTLISLLQKWGTPPDLLPSEITNENGQSQIRAKLFQRGGIFLITSRILIVDLLTSVASPTDIDGIMVAHADKVSEQSTEAFILRIYRTQKRWGGDQGSDDSVSDSPLLQSFKYGFVKAFTDAPDVLMSGFAKVDKILKALFVKRLYLYPRFHESIADDLEANPPVVLELRPVLTPKMKSMQSAIAVAVQTCIREIKSSTTLLEYAETDLTLENCITTNFDLSISRQLEHDWHRLKPSTKQLVNDLRTLRMLFHYLIQYDCISFWKLINSIKTMSATSQRHPSMWLLTPAAEKLFQNAKDRIYKIGLTASGRNSGASKNKKSKESGIGGGMRRLIPVLEENPKWRLLHQVLTNIEEKWNAKQEEERKMKKKAKKDSNNQSDEGKTSGGARVLVMVKDERTLEAIQSYLLEGKERTMSIRWLRYLKQINDKARVFAKNAGGSSHISEESRLLLEDESRVRNFLFGNAETNFAAPYPVETEERKVDTKVQSRVEYDDAFSISSSDDEENAHFKAEPIDDLQVIIRTYSSTEGEESYLLLDDIKPAYVVLYDAEPSFIRSLEIYSANNASNSPSNSKSDEKKKEGSVTVYFMLFEASSEEKNYLKALERETNAFERLIQHKKTMPLPVNTMGPWTTQEVQMAGPGVTQTYMNGTLPLAVDTRTGKGRAKSSTERRDIVVDVREFRSSLPSILHQGGMRLAPVTLTVGDFVLTNVHVVERKSISDLYGSFASGRLFTQATSMTKYYKCPCLLIEFDPAKTFALQNINDIGTDIRVDSICSKMSLLVMHFPKLRLLWSRSPYETLKLFKALKTSHEEVDVNKAIEYGSNESIDALLKADDDEDEGEENEINEAARDLLLRLPGITVHNARTIMNRCDSIAELAEIPRNELKEMLGPVTGQRLFSFLNQKYEPG